MRIEIEPQPADFIRSLAPKPRRAVRRALRELQEGKVAVKALGGKLLGFLRLRVMTYRVIFLYMTAEQSRERYILCVFAEHRSVVYTEFEATLPSQNGQTPPA